MNNNDKNLWPTLIVNTRPDSILCMAMEHVSEKLAEMLGLSFQLSALDVETLPLGYLAASVENPESEVVGVYLLSSDDLPGQAILILSLTDAMSLADLLLEEPVGTTTELGELERSALAETGNQVLSAFLNAIAKYSGKMLRLSPPAVMVDMLAAVLQVVITPIAPVTDELIIIKTGFTNSENSLSIRFWVLPDPIAFEYELTGRTNP